MSATGSKRGRPKSGQPRKKLHAVYLTPDQYRRCRLAAGARLFSQWASEALLAAAEAAGFGEKSPKGTRHGN